MKKCKICNNPTVKDLCADFAVQLREGTTSKSISELKTWMEDEGYYEGSLPTVYKHFKECLDYQEKRDRGIEAKD